MFFCLADERPADIRILVLLLGHEFIWSICVHLVAPWTGKRARPALV